MQQIKDNLLKVAKIVIDKIVDLQSSVDKREAERVYYDHYRNKVEEMEKPGKESTSSNI